jgi:hypothetical protein
MPSAGAGRPPRRTYHVMLLGAGASKAAGLPLTEELLRRVLDRDETGHTWSERRRRADWENVLTRAFQILYPDGGARGFRPSVAGFFTLLEVVAQVHEGRERMPLGAHTLLRDLRCEIALGLEAVALGLAANGTPHAAWFSSTHRPSVVVTTNWDTVIERAARAVGLTVRLSWPLDRIRRRRALRGDELVVLKLHGSTDWGTSGARTFRGPRVSDFYTTLSQPVGEWAWFRGGRIPDARLLRYRSLDEDDPVNILRGLGFDPPFMSTMAIGKEETVNALASVWDDAYWVLSRARELDVLGYSFPDDDLEIRTLIRVTSRKAASALVDPQLTLRVINPAPDAHDRARAYLGSSIASDYRTGSTWAP